MWGLASLAGLRRSRAVRSTKSPSTSARPVSRAVRQAIESLEARVFMHAGAHITPTATFPYNGQQRVATTTGVTITFSTDVNASTLNSTNFELRDSNNNLVPATRYMSGTKTIVLDPVSNLATSNSYYTVILKGGANSVKDTAGNGLDDDLRFGFTTGTAQFTRTQVLGGLSAPVATQFASDGRVFVAEQSGMVKVFDNVNDTTPTTVADLRTQVHNFWDRGLLGMALHPNFPATPYIYLLYTFDADIGGTAPKYGSAGVTSDPGPDATGNGALVSGRLSRITISGNTMVAGSETVLINDWAQQFPSHSIGSLAFGPDGALYASAGDGASFNYADYGQTGNPFNDPVNEGGALRSQDLRTPNDPTTLDGTIIRINPDTGAALPDNPLFATGNDANAKRIIAYGFRNPFRITFRPGTNEIWSGDVGWGTWEEINRLTVSTTTVSNYGWPAYEGPNRQSGYDALNLPLLENLYNEGATAVVTPYFAYRHSDKVVTGSAEPTGGSSISGLAFYNGTSYPSPYKGALFFSDYSREAIYVMYPGLNGLPDPASRQVFQLDATVGPVQILAGPNGDIFVVDRNNRLWRYTYASTNAPPTAVITTNVTNGPAPLTVNFSAASSTDPDAGDVLSYSWDLNGDGTFGDSTAVNPTYTYSAPGSYVVSLRVTDIQGASNIATRTITSGNTAPVPTITSPPPSANWKVGDTINFAATATDLQDGTLGASAFSWQLILRHESLINPGSYHEHLIQTYTGVMSGSFVAPDHEYPSSLELRLTVTDSGGLTAEQALLLQPQTSTISFTSNIAGAKVSLNGEELTTPFTRTAIVGSANVVVATTPQTVNGVIYNFVSWSDGGAATHNVTLGASPLTLNAVFAGAATVPVPWRGNDVGSVGIAGSSTYDPVTQTFTINGAGADIWGTQDSFHFISQQVTGDIQIVARVKSIQNTHNNAKAGIQIRQSLAANAANVQIDVEGPGTWGEFHVRPTAGAETSTQAIPTITTPRWLKLTRIDNVFTAYHSTDGVTWTQIAQTTVAMTGNIEVGLAVCSHDVNSLNTSLFDNVSVTSLANAIPTILTPATANVAADGKTANLAVSADDDGGEANLKYVWSRVSGPATVTFAPNNSNASKSSVATFTRAGSYVLRVTATDALGKSVTSDVTVNVTQLVTDIVLTPAAIALTVGQTQQFVATARDQFGIALATQPAFTWALDAGSVGTVSAAGLYTAPASGSGSATVRATGGGKSGTATVTIGAAVADVTAGLVNRWKFDENTGTLADDAVGTNNGTLTGGAGWTSGVAGAALNLDGVNDYAATTASMAGTLGGTATLTAWIKTTQIGSAAFWEAPGLVGVEQYWGNNDIFWGILNDQGRISVKAGDDAAATSNVAVNDGLWHHVAFTRNVSTGALQVYVDGVLAGSAVGGIGTKSTAFASIGRIQNTNGPANHLEGQVDDVRIYNRIQTAAEVVAVKANPGDVPPVPPPPPPPAGGDVTAGLVNRWKFNETAGTSAADSVGTNTGTLTNGPTFTAGQSGNAVTLDGTNDYVATGGLGTLGGTSTLSAWIKTTQAGTSTFWTAPGIAGVEQYWGSNDVFWGIIDTQGRISVKAGDDAAASSTTAINDGVWHHVAFTRNAGTGALQVFVDGVLEGTAVGAVGTKSTPFNSIGRIENTNGAANHLQGSLDDVRVYSRVLTAQEVIDVRANIGS